MTGAWRGALRSEPGVKGLWKSRVTLYKNKLDMGSDTEFSRQEIGQGLEEVLGKLYQRRERNNYHEDKRGLETMNLSKCQMAGNGAPEW